MKNIYLDYAATTYIEPDILKEMRPYLVESYGNASSIHTLGRAAKAAIENARMRIAKTLHCEKNEIYFTSSATESNNWALKGIAFANRYKGNHIITTQIEHPSVLKTCSFLEKNGFEITYLPVNEYGLVSIEDLKKSIKEETILISIMFANNEIGTIQPIKEIGEFAYERGIYFHTDAVQAIGKVPIDVTENNIDLLSLSGHKIYGPKGIGVLYIKSDVEIENFIHGGAQEKGRRAGTEHVANCIGLSHAIEISIKAIDINNKKIRLLEKKLINGIYLNIGCSKLNGHPTKRLPGTVNFSFRDVHGKTLVLLLDELGIYVSSGSACSCGLIKPSHVLLAIGLSEKSASESIRFTLSRDNTEEEINYVIQALSSKIKLLRENIL